MPPCNISLPTRGSPFTTLEMTGVKQLWNPHKILKRPLATDVI